MTPADTIRLAQIRLDYGALSEDAHGHAGALAFVLRLLEQEQIMHEHTTFVLAATEGERNVARQQAIEECAQAICIGCREGLSGVGVGFGFGGLIYPWLNRRFSAPAPQRPPRSPAPKQ